MAIREKEHRRNRFTAAMKGIDIDESTNKGTTFEDVQRKANAILQGKSEEELELEDFGIQIINEG